MPNLAIFGSAKETLSAYTRCTVRHPHTLTFYKETPLFIMSFQERLLAASSSERRAIQIPDAENEKAYAKGTPFYSGTIEFARARTIIAVPLLKDDELVGAIVIFRQEVRALHRQADRAADKLRVSGRYWHRERAATQRASQIVCSSRLPQPTCSR